MSKGKLQKFAEMETFPNVFQFPYSVAIKDEFPLKGKWANSYFKNNNPIILELGCGKGEYTVGLGKMFPNIKINRHLSPLIFIFLLFATCEV